MELSKNVLVTLLLIEENKIIGNIGIPTQNHLLAGLHYVVIHKRIIVYNLNCHQIFIIAFYLHGVI